MTQVFGRGQAVPRLGGAEELRPLVSWKCVLSVWKSGGPSSTTWHADFIRNDSKACSMRWDNGNTLTVTVK
jgi:hypothetical protein